MLTELKKFTIGEVATALSGTKLLTDAPTVADFEVADVASAVDKIAFKADGKQISIKFVQSKANTELEASGKAFDINGDSIPSKGIKAATIVFGVPVAGLAVTVSGHSALNPVVTSAAYNATSMGF